MKNNFVVPHHCTVRGNEASLFGNIFSVDTILPRCYAPPFLRPTSRKKGGRRNNEDLHFRLAVKPPPPLPRIRVLCSAVEDENSFDRHAVAVLKDGRVVGHVHVAIFLQYIAGSLAARLLPPAATAG